MNDDPNFTLLQQAGDPLEIVICKACEDLFPALLPYARVWAKHIYPRRVGDGSEITKEWMPLGGSHYTALIRLYHAYQAKERLLALCKKVEEMRNPDPTIEDYAILLEIHGVCASFWENLGSAVDNFAHVWDDARRLLVGNAKHSGEHGDEPISGKTISEVSYPKLNFAFSRRTQFIHWRLVPKRLEGGMVIFNIRHYDDEKTVWLPETEELETIDSQIKKNWDEVLNELGSAWSKLFSWLQSKDRHLSATKVVELHAVGLKTEFSPCAHAPLSGVDQSSPSTFAAPPSGSRASQGRG